MYIISKILNSVKYVFLEGFYDSIEDMVVLDIFTSSMPARSDRLYTTLISKYTGCVSDISTGKSTGFRCNFLHRVD